MSKQVKVKLFRKAWDMEDVKELESLKIFDVETLDVQKTINLNEDQYNSLTENFNRDVDFLTGLDYSANRTNRTSVEITCKGHPTIYIAPEGYTYARYVGIKTK